MGIIRKYLLGYKKDKEYWIQTKEIIITPEFATAPPSYKKYKNKKQTFLKYGLLKPIKLNRNYELVDGFISYIILKEFNCGKMPVYFIEDTICD